MLQNQQLKEQNSIHTKVAVLIPCYNEAKTIGTVVEDFRKHLPFAEIYVYDNNSSDKTALVALEAGAAVRREHRQGKGNVVRRMFQDVEADVYILVDGDSTYEAGAAPRMIAAMRSGPFDMVNGVRVHSEKTAYRAGHVLGNRLFTGMVGRFFNATSRDMLSGYKAFSRRFVKTFPSISSGFEIETEILVHALELDMAITEIDTVYGERPSGSVSKLSTFRDGFRILWLIIHLIRDFMPLQFFSSISVVLLLLSILSGTPVVYDFFQTGLVPRLPTAVVALGLMILAFLALFAGFILDSVARGRREAKLLSFLRFPSVGA